MKIIGLAGWSGSGKTTCLVGILPLITRRGLSVSTIKHSHHRVPMGRSEATETLVASPERWALIREFGDGEEPPLDHLIARMSPVDLLIVEGYKTHRHPKIEVLRPSIGKPALWPDDPDVVAVASDEVLAGLPVPLLPLNDHAAIVDFILRFSATAPTAPDPRAC